MVARATTPAKRGRKPSSIKSIKDPGPLVSRWYAEKKELDKALAKVQVIAERMNTIQSQAATRFDMVLPFITRNGSIRQDEGQQMDSRVAPSVPEEAPTKRSSVAPLPTQSPVSENHVRNVTSEGVEITTGPMALSIGREGDLREMAARQMDQFRRAIL